MEKKMYYGQQTKSPFRDPERAKELAGISTDAKMEPVYEAKRSANDRQPGGNHYKKHGDLQPWDIVALWNLDFFQGNILKYVVRWRDKGGIQDLEKAMHYLEKYIEVERAKEQERWKQLPVYSTGGETKECAKIGKPAQLQADEIKELYEDVLSQLAAGKGVPLDASGGPFKRTVEVDGIKFDPQRNYELTGGEGTFVPPDLVERSKEVLTRLKEVDENRLGEAAAHPERFGTNKKVQALTVEEILADTEPLDEREDREYYEPASKELGIPKEELRARKILSEAPGMDALAAEIAGDARAPQHVDLPPVDGNGSPVI